MSEDGDGSNVELMDVLMYAMKNLSQEDLVFFLLQARKEILKEAAASLSEPRMSLNYLQMVTALYGSLDEMMKAKDE